MQRSGSANLRIIVVLLAVALLGVAILRGRGSGPGSLPILAPAPTFRLLAQTGESFESSNLEGKISIASFIYTTCPGPCPLVVRAMKTVDEGVRDIDRVHLLSFSVDPEQDTPEVLAAYAIQHGIPTERWTLLTGPLDDMMKTIRTGFLMGTGDTAEFLENATEQEIAEAVATQGRVTHSTRFVLMDAELRIRGYYHSDDPADVERLVSDAHLLAKAR